MSNRVHKTVNGDVITFNAANCVVGFELTKKTRDELKAIRGVFKLADDYRDYGCLEMYRHWEKSAVTSVARFVKDMQVEYNDVIDLVFDTDGTLNMYNERLSEVLV